MKYIFSKWLLGNNIEFYVTAFLTFFILVFFPNTCFSVELAGEYRNKFESVLFDPTDKTVFIKTLSLFGKVKVHGNYKIISDKVYIFDKTGKSHGEFTINGEILVAERDSRVKSLMSPKLMESQLKLVSLGKNIYEKGIRNGMMWSVSACLSCHGRQAEGTSEGPSMSNLSKFDFTKAISDYKKDLRNDTKSYLMNNLARDLMNKEAEAIWYYISSLTNDDFKINSLALLVAEDARVKSLSIVAPKSSKKEIISRGKKIYKRSTNNLFSCEECHGIKATGNKKENGPTLININRENFINAIRDYAFNIRIDKNPFSMNRHAKYIFSRDESELELIWYYINSLKH